MAIQVNETDAGRTIEVRVSGKLVHEDYRHFVPEFERLAKQHGKLRVLFEMADFHGWDTAALWDDVKFDVKHFSDIERHIDKLLHGNPVDALAQHEHQE